MKTLNDFKEWLDLLLEEQSADDISGLDATQWPIHFYSYEEC